MSNIPCRDPVLGESLFDAMRPGGRGLSPEQQEHLRRCAGCRISVERQRRLAAAWPAAEPAVAEVRAARARFMTPAGKRRPIRMVPRAAALVVVLAAAAASAAVRVAVTRWTRPAHETAVSMDSLPGVPAAKARRHGVAARLHPDAPAGDAGVASGPTVTETAPELAVEDLPPSPAVAPSSTHRVVVPSFPLAAPSAAAEPSKKTEPSPSPWTVAAAAMRDGDYQGAEAAFDTLARSTDPSTRDAARLARAQVWIADGRAAEARPELEDLSTTGATPLVRKRATALLETLP